MKMEMVSSEPIFVASPAPTWGVVVWRRMVVLYLGRVALAFGLPWECPAFARYPKENIKWRLVVGLVALSWWAR